MSKGKTNTNSLKCVVDLRSIPPSAFVLSEDGRKAKYMGRLRKELAFFLSTYANPDGSSIRPSRITMASSLGVAIRTVSRLLVDLKTLGYLSDDGWHVIGETRLRNRALHVAKIQQVAGASTVPDTNPAEVPTVPDSASTVPDTRSRCAILAEPLCQIHASTVPDSFGTQPPLIHRPSEPPTQPPTQPASPKGARGSVCVDSQNQKHSFEAWLEQEAKAENTLDQVMQHCHTDMLASQWKKGEQDFAQKLIAQHGWETFVAIEGLYWQEQDPHQFGKTLFKWSGMLASYTGWLMRVTPAMLREQSWRRWGATPEGEAEKQRQAEASITQANAAEMRAREARDKELRAKRTPYDDEMDKHAAVQFAEIRRYWQGEEVVVDQACWKHPEVDFCFVNITVAKPGTKDRYEFSVDEATGKLVAKPVEKDDPYARAMRQP